MGIEYLNFRVADRVPAVRPGQHRDACLRPADGDRPLKHIQRRHLLRGVAGADPDRANSRTPALPSATTV